MSLETDAHPPLGPAFLNGDDGPLYRFVVDRSCVVGPRAVTQADKDAHPALWAAFEAGPIEPEREPEPAAPVVEPPVEPEST